MDFRLTEDGDLDIEGGMSVVTGVREKRQRLELALNLNLTEWFLDINRGLPFIENVNESLSDPSVQYFFDKNIPDAPSFITQELTRYIRKQDFVDNVESSFTFNSRTREYVYNCTILTDENEEFSIEPYVTTL